MRMSNYAVSVLLEFLAVVSMTAGFFLFLYSASISQQAEAQAELYWFDSWIVFVASLIVFTAALLLRRRALRRIRNPVGDSPT